MRIFTGILSVWNENFNKEGRRVKVEAQNVADAVEKLGGKLKDKEEICVIWARNKKDNYVLVWDWLLGDLSQRQSRNKKQA